MQMPEPLQRIFALKDVYNRTCLLDLPFPGLTDRPNLAVWLFDDRATKWRASVQALVQQLCPSSRAMVYLQGHIATQILHNGFCELLHKRDTLLDVLVLHILCLEHGGVEALMRWTDTSDCLRKKSLTPSRIFESQFLWAIVKCSFAAAHWISLT